MKGKCHEYRDLYKRIPRPAGHPSHCRCGHIRSPERRGRADQTAQCAYPKIYALAGGEGLDRLISYNERVSKHIPTDEYEKSNLAHVLIDEFGDHLFWDELIARLSVRDAAQA